MKMNLLLATILMLCTACGGQNAKKSTGNTDAAGNYTPDSVLIYSPHLKPPTIITDPKAQIMWVADHYWDEFQFADTLAVPRWSDYAEQAFVNVLYAMAGNNVSFDVAAGTMTSLFRGASVNKAAFMKFAEITEKYLFDSVHELRNEELYIVVLRAVVDYPALDEWERIRPQEQLRLALKNRVGDLANDFRYTLESGATGTLRTLKARYTLLFFNNPGCPGCRLTMDQIGASQFLTDLIENGTLTVLAVYTDTDLDAWREYNPQMPKHWILSYDAGEKIKNEDMYDLKAIPTLYLLDSNKRVMLKDEMSIPRIEQTLYNALNPQPAQQ